MPPSFFVPPSRRRQGTIDFRRGSRYPVRVSIVVGDDHGERMENEQLAALVRISADLVGTLDEKEVIQKMVIEAAKMLEAEACSLILLDDATDECFFYSASNATHELLQIHFNRELGIVGKVLSSGKPVLVADAASDPYHYAGVDQRTGMRSIKTRWEDHLYR